jgi:hypothetical protein
LLEAGGQCFDFVSIFCPKILTKMAIFVPKYSNLCTEKVSLKRITFFHQNVHRIAAY